MVYSYLSEEKLRAGIKQVSNAKTAQKLLLILNGMVDPRRAREIALHTGVSVRSIHNWIPAYVRSGLAGIVGPGPGGWRNEWRQVMSRPCRDQSNKQVQEVF